MKAAVAAGAFVFLVLFVVTTFVPSPEAQLQAEAYGFTPNQIDDGLDYAFQRKLLFWSSAAVRLAFLAWLVFWGGAARLMHLANRITKSRWLLNVLLMGAAVFLAEELLALPFGLLGLNVQRSWGMSHQSLMDWLHDYEVALAVQAVTGVVVLLGLYALLLRYPRNWWLPASIGVGVLAVAYAFLLPVVIEPLFNDFRPLDDPVLTKKVEQLAARAGIEIDEVLVMDASRRSSHTNAYFTGFGSTRRIVLYDTLLNNHLAKEAGPTHLVGQTLGAQAVAPAAGPMASLMPILVAAEAPEAGAFALREEVESILGHEIGHWQHQHIVKGIFLATLGALVSLFVLSRILLWAVGRRPWCLTRPADPAGLPLILLLGFLGSWLAMPVQNAVSRYFESQADATALQLADHPKAFINAERRLAVDNKSNVAPNPFSAWLFATHPTAIERIQMARDWETRAKSESR